MLGKLCKICALKAQTGILNSDMYPNPVDSLIPNLIPNLTPNFKCPRVLI